MRAAHFCQACGKVQPPVPVDYFTFFGLPPQAESRCRRSWNATSTSSAASCIPTSMPAPTSDEQEWSLEQSSLLNDAYRTLKDPITRTEYLLRLEGVRTRRAVEEPRPSKRAPAGAVKKQVVPPDLLEEVFELNMQLEELRMNKKMGEDDPDRLQKICRQKPQLEAKHDGLLEELRRRLELSGTASSTATATPAKTVLTRIATAAIDSMVAYAESPHTTSAIWLREM